MTTIYWFFLNTKIWAVENEKPDTFSLAASAVFNTKFGAVENEIKKILTLKYQKWQRNLY